MLLRRPSLACLAIALVCVGLIAPVAHALAAHDDHEHATCSVCQALAGAHDAVISANEFPLQPMLAASPVLSIAAGAFTPAFDYAVALPRGPPSCLEV